MAKKSLSWSNVVSSNVKALSYDDTTETLAVKFNNGGLYTYHCVDMDVYTGFAAAKSVGSYLAIYVKPFHPFTQWTKEEEIVDYIRERKEIRHG